MIWIEPEEIECVFIAMPYLGFCEARYGRTVGYPVLNRGGVTVRTKSGFEALLGEEDCGCIEHLHVAYSNALEYFQRLKTFTDECRVAQEAYYAEVPAHKQPKRSWWRRIF